nr:TPM domain-containing protein [Lachnospiraceae bacterium]
MKQYFKRFWFWYVIVAVMLIVYLVARFSGKNADQAYVRTNTECLTEERVFDYADKMSDSEEDALRELIAKREQQVGCDIVLVTLNDSELDSDAKMMKYADYFCIDNKFGYNRAVGDAVIYVDNWYNGYVWMCTSGKAEARYSSSMIDSLIKHACDVVNSNPYKGYERYVNRIYRDLSSNSVMGSFRINNAVILIVALIVTVIYLIAGLSGHKGKRTTTASTYVANGRPDLRNTEDIFINKHVTKHKIESSSSSGGGGGHHTTGGHSFGGGGGRH